MGRAFSASLLGAFIKVQEARRRGHLVRALRPKPRQPSRPRLRAWLFVSLLCSVSVVWLLPGVAARVEVSDVVVPARTLAGQPWPASLVLTNDATPRSVTLLAALYDPAAKAPGDAPCGSSTGDAFRTFTQLMQEDIALSADQRIDYPLRASERWLQRYATSDVPTGDSVMEWCVFVVERRSSPDIAYEGFASVTLPTRRSNEAPSATFEAPAPVFAARSVVFEGRGDDADAGDADNLTFHWDFGHVNASGRATAEGERVSHAFYPAGTYTVTLSVDDGYTTTRVTREVSVLPEDGAPAAEGPVGLDAPPARTPGPGLAWLVAATFMAALGRRHKARD